MSIDAMQWAKRQKAGAAKLVLLVLADYADEHGYSYPALETLADVSEQGPATVRRHLRLLERAGLLRTEARYRPQGGRSTNGFHLSMFAHNQNERAANDRGGALTGYPQAPIGNQEGKEQPVEQLGEQPIIGAPAPPDPRVQLWDVFVEVTGKTRYTLTDTRRRRMANVAKFLRRRDDMPATTKPLNVWRCMVRCLWSDEWRRAEQSRHDPVNTLSRPEQIERWYLAACGELAAGRTGASWHEHHEPERRGGGRAEAAAEEAGVQQARRDNASRQAAARVEHEAEATRAAEKSWGTVRAWYGGLDQVTRAAVEREVRELAPTMEGYRFQAALTAAWRRRTQAGPTGNIAATVQQEAQRVAAQG